MPTSIYAIGDIQGCYDPLRRLLDAFGFDERKDRLWLVGDLVNRGPQSLAVLRFVRSLGAAVSMVLGNHDLHLILRAAGYGKPSAEDTFDDVLNAPERDELIDWLRRQPLCHVEAGCVLVHAGLLPQWSAEQAQALSNEVCSALTAPDRDAFLAQLWGSEPIRWADELAGWARLRVIVNAMTRMRFCHGDGAMEFRAAGSKGTLADAPPGCVPWFDLPDRRSTDHTVICGHWSALGLYARDNLVALDSGCLWGGALSAVRLADRALFQVGCTGKNSAVR